MLQQKKLKKQADRVRQCAIEKYGPLKNRKQRSALEQLILSVFGQRTSVGQSTRALRSLKRRFVDWNEVRVSHPAELMSVLPGTNWARVGAEQLVWLLRELYDRRSQLEMDFLADLTAAQARSCLQSLPMVQRDMADQVLLLSLGISVLPLSAEAARMCYRLGMLENERPTIRNQRAVTRLFEPELYTALHMFFADHAGKLCAPEEPGCTDCPLAPHCPSSQ